MPPLNFLRTGYYYRTDGNVNNRTSSGDWWSDASSSDTNGYSLGTGSTNVFLQLNYSRGYGFAVRCVVREG